MYVKLRKHRD